MYLKYKKAQIPINKYLDDPLLIMKLDNRELLRIVGISNKVATLRKQYQSIAFKKQFLCEGHTAFITKLMNLSDTITSVLEQRFNAYIHPSANCDDSEDICVDVPSVSEDTSTKVQIDKFLISRKELMAELDMLIKEKERLMTEIRNKVMTIYHVINPLLRGGDLLITDKSCALICLLDTIQRNYQISIAEIKQNTAILQKVNASFSEDTFKDTLSFGKSIADTFPEWEQTIKSGYSVHTALDVFNSLTRPDIRRTPFAINWNEILCSLEDCVEYIYQGRLEVPTLPDDPVFLEAVACLIDVARTHETSFLWYFDIDTETNKVFVKVHNYRDTVAVGSTKQFKKR
jgi:hypothetical protein